MTDSEDWHCHPGIAIDEEYGADGYAQQTSCTDIDNGGECHHCDCCCECLGCEYGPRGESAVGMTDAQRAPAAAIEQATR